MPRGQSEILHETLSTLHRQYDLEDIEDAVLRLPEILQAATARYADAQGIDDHRQYKMFGAYLGGWSERANRMAIWEFTNFTCDFEPQGARTEPGVIVLPELPAKYVPPG